jgi:hypothetical protein
MRVIDGVEVDRESDVIGDEDELDHPAMLKKIGCIADCENVGIAENRKIFAEVITFSCADKYNGAGFCGRDVREVSDMNGKTINRGIGGKSVKG